MRMENGLLVNVPEIHDIVKQADVFAMGFRLFSERLLIDTRFDAGDPEGPCAMPMVAIVDPVPTVQERFFWLGQHRPSLGLPQNFMFVFWPHSIAYLEESGVWAAVTDRIVPLGFDGAARTCDAALEDLLRRERAANVDAITGERYQTLWSAEPA
jgi:hypothetical protein